MAQAMNPYLPSYEYVPDGEPRIFGDRLYVYGSHDAFDGPDFCVNDYVCWSAPLTDLADWKYEGIIYRADQDPANKKNNMHMCAPDCVQGADGRYYLYYQLHVLTCTSVAVADSPTGPFAFYGYVQHEDGTPWGNKKGDSFAFDPGVLVDDDGEVYCYVGFSPVGLFKKVFKMRGCKVDGGVCLHLAKDMKTVIGEEKPTVPGRDLAVETAYGKDGEHGFFEASSPRKIGGKYYLIYSSFLSHELCYAVSDYPDRDFTYGGTIVSIGDVGLDGRSQADALNNLGNTHGGMVEVDGQWYIFYHRQTNKQKCARQGCAEKVEILEDGSIPQVEITSCGLNDGPLVAKGTYEARIACNLRAKEGVLSYTATREKDKKALYPYFTQTGGDRESDGNQYIANMKDGAMAGFKYFDFAGDEQKITVTVGGNADGSLHVKSRLDGGDLAKIPVHTCGAKTSATADLSCQAGRYALYFVYEGSGSLDFIDFTIQ